MDEQETLGLRGICERFLSELETRMQVRPVAAGGAVVGVYCPHHQVMAVRRIFSEELAGRWQLSSHAQEGDLRIRMALMAGIADGVAENDAKESRQAGVDAKGMPVAAAGSIQ